MKPEEINESNWVEALADHLRNIEEREYLDKQPTGPLTITIRETLPQKMQNTLRQLRDSLPTYCPPEEVAS